MFDKEIPTPQAKTVLNGWEAKQASGVGTQACAHDEGSQDPGEGVGLNGDG